ncbi:hypothetical protein HYW36_01215 [Candidatus Saccharibacteria bacterium]|nr:hypothetical protein [Candidatus Saccharibacteria bacterium]
MTYAECASPSGKPKIAKKTAVRPAALDGRLAGAGDVRLVFFGSGPVAAASLRLLAADFDFEAVITKPKPAHHHGGSPVVELAKQLKLPIYTASNKTELDAIFTSQRFLSRLGVLIDFGIIISPKVIDYFPLGIINSHFSVLPQWRGADPITFAVLSGQKTTGVSLMLLVEKMDEGPLLAYAQYEMSQDVTTPKLTQELIKISHGLLQETLPKYLAGELQPVPQSATGYETSYSRRLVKQDGVVDWNKSADQLEREVRAYAGWPKSQAKIFGHDVIITKARVANSQKDGDLVMFCGPGPNAEGSGFRLERRRWLEIQQLIAPSGRKITGADFLRGYSSGR